MDGDSISTSELTW